MSINFDEVWGQEAACTVLSRNLENSRLSSGYLFTGPQGTGKTLTASIFAKSILCQSAGELPCGNCRSCRQFDAGSHPDFSRVVPDGVFIKIEQMRFLIAALSLKSYMGGRKAVVIENAEKMNRESANSFLKTLEEPPPGSVIILVTARPAALLQTVVSRCRQVRFVPMRSQEFASLLEKERGMTPADAYRAAELAEGCPGRVLGGAMEKLSQIDGEAMELIGTILKLSPGEASLIAERWRNRRDELPLLMERMMEILRRLQQPNSNHPSGTMTSVRDSFGAVPPANLLKGFESILETMPALRFNPNIQLFMESTIYNLQSILLKGEPLADSTA